MNETPDKPLDDADGKTATRAADGAAADKNEAPLDVGLSPEEVEALAESTDPALLELLGRC